MPSPRLAWVLLTQGTRASELENAVDSVVGAADEVLVVSNGAGQLATGAETRTLVLDHNEGVPGGRDRGLRATASEIVCFLDDDARLLGSTQAIRDAFAADAHLGAVALRLVDEEGGTSRRHVPRPGATRSEESGDVANFLGGACAIRREAYVDAGGYFVDLVYGHEEIELSWRLIDRGWSIRYLADVQVFHPRTEIGRHPRGWWLTGRNRVWVARRTLPWPVAIIHVATWLVLGAMRAPAGECRSRYVRGWFDGWRTAVEHQPISWRTVWRLTTLGRPPVI